MTEQEILEGNKTIAEFMKGKSRFNEQMQTKVVYGIQSLPGIGLDEIEWKELELAYHASWAWLMAVVEKIENLDAGRGLYAVEIEGISCAIVFKDETDHPMYYVHHPEAESKILAVVTACVQFIQWYNQNK